MAMDERFKLCYVFDNWAYFTTQDVVDQWGDDWNDAPYEHNAGRPYEYSYMVNRKNEETGKWESVPNPEPFYEIDKVAFQTELETPSGYGNSGFSVQTINRGVIPWLQTDRYSSGPRVRIWAGTSYPEFVQLILQTGGMIYERIEGR